MSRQQRRVSCLPRTSKRSLHSNTSPILYQPRWTFTTTRSIGRTICRPLSVNGTFGYSSLESSTSYQFTTTYASIIEPTTGRPDLKINPSAARQPSRGSPKIGKRQTAEQTQNPPQMRLIILGVASVPPGLVLPYRLIILSSISPDHHSLFSPSYLRPSNFFLPPPQEPLS